MYKRQILVLLVMLLEGNQLISRKISKPIRELDASVKAHEAGGKPDIYIGGSSEIRHLGHSVQKSYEQIEKLMDEIIRQQNERRKSEMDALQSQINPHFLFNSLNVLASLAYQDTEKTNRFAKKLSTVYRYLLTTHGRATVTVQEELSFVESYLYLEHIRFGDALHVEIEDDLRNHHCLVIPASIQMLVENALKHNISTKKSPLIVHISIGNERITVRNNLQLRNYVASNGAGLKNLQRQYALYGTLVEILKDEKEFVVKLPFVGEDVNRLSTI